MVGLHKGKSTVPPPEVSSDPWKLHSCRCQSCVDDIKQAGMAGRATTKVPSGIAQYPPHIKKKPVEVEPYIYDKKSVGQPKEERVGFPKHKLKRIDPNKVEPEPVFPPPTTTDEFGRGYYKVEQMTVDYQTENGIKPSNNEEANLIGSKRVSTPDFHLPVIDIDHPCRWVESSTPGHGHLYIDTVMTKANYSKLLQCLRDVGLVESGFATAFNKQGQTFVRPPWVHKTPEEIKSDKKMLKKSWY